MLEKNQIPRNPQESRSLCQAYTSSLLWIYVMLPSHFYSYTCEFCWSDTQILACKMLSRVNTDAIQQHSTC